MEDKRIIEINGIKLEVDLRTARRIDTFRVGDGVKVLSKEYTTPKIYAGVIVGFGEFASTNIIEILVLEEGYNTVDVKFITVTNETKDTEIIPYNSYERLFTADHIYDLFDKQIEKKKMEIEGLEHKKECFANDFMKAFSVGQPGELAK